MKGQACGFELNFWLNVPTFSSWSHGGRERGGDKSGPIVSNGAIDTFVWHVSYMPVS